MNSPRDLEDELKEALRREQPSAGFSARVMERLERKHRYRARAWMAIAAMLVIGILITAAVRVREQDREVRQASSQITAQRAAHELTIALKITGRKLQATRMQIRRRSNGA